MPSAQGPARSTRTSPSASSRTRSRSWSSSLRSSHGCRARISGSRSPLAVIGTVQITLASSTKWSALLHPLLALAVLALAGCRAPRAGARPAQPARSRVALRPGRDVRSAARVRARFAGGLRSRLRADGPPGRAARGARRRALPAARAGRPDGHRARRDVDAGRRSCAPCVLGSRSASWAALGARHASSWSRRCASLRPARGATRRPGRRPAARGRPDGGRPARRSWHGARPAPAPRCSTRVFGEGSDTWARTASAPAAKLFHQAYRHGLLEHSLTVAQAVSAISATFPGIDRDVAVTGALLHDIGKLEAYAADPARDRPDRRRAPAGRDPARLLLRAPRDRGDRRLPARASPRRSCTSSSATTARSSTASPVVPVHARGDARALHRQPRRAAGLVRPARAGACRRASAGRGSTARSAAARTSRRPATRRSEAAA